MTRCTWALMNGLNLQTPKERSEMTTPNEELLARAKRLRHELGDSNSRLDRQCVTAMYEMEQALQSQAECIATLEDDVESLQKNIDTTCSSAAELIAKCFAECDTLRAELAAIAATEPDSYLVEGWHKGELWAKHHNFTLEEAKNSASVFTQHYTTVHTIPLFTRPMPAQGVAELVEAFEHHIEQTRPIERSTIALSKYKE